MVSKFTVSSRRDVERGDAKQEHSNVIEKEEDKAVTNKKVKSKKKSSKKKDSAYDEELGFCGSIMVQCELQKKFVISMLFSFLTLGIMAWLFSG